MDELDHALAHGAEAILLDNMPSEEVGRAVERCSKFEHRVVIECSGGIRLDNVRAYAETGVNYVSVGALTHAARSLHVSLEVL